MKKLITTLLLAVGLNAMAVEQIELFITITNTPVTGDTLTINATTRTWTNANSASTILTNLASLPENHSTTNLFQNLSLYYLTENPVVIKNETNQLRLIFAVGTGVTASESGNWASLSYTTNTITKAWTVRVPMSIEAATNQTNFASMLVTGLGKATNRFQGAWEAMTNFAVLAGQNQFIGTNNLGTGGGWNRPSLTNVATLSGTLGALTNGVLTNAILQSPLLTNGVNYGNAFRSPGSGAASTQLGSNALATGTQSTAVGNSSSASGFKSIAIGQGADSGGPFDLIIGQGSEGGAGMGINIGNSSSASKTNSITIGNSSLNDGINSVIIGNSLGLGASESNTVLIGTNIHEVRVPGRFTPTGTITNAPMTGETGIGVSGGPYGFLSFRRYNNATLANGNNYNVNPGESSYMKVSGPNAAFAICGITNVGTKDGRFLIIQNSSVYPMTIANDDGADPTPANRIYTGTGADIATTNNPATVQLIYDTGASRWIVLNHSN